MGVDSCIRPQIDFPHRVPLKIIGRKGELSSDLIAKLIKEHLKQDPNLDQPYTTNQNGPYVSFTFWVILPNGEAERPLREAIQKLPGYVMQL